MLSIPKICLIQLPLLDAGESALKANVPLAAGYLKSYALKQKLPVSMEIMPSSLANHGGDEALLRWILEAHFEVIAFTVYMWNRERSLNLARNIKKRRNLTIVFGGPEIVDKGFLWEDPSVDCFVSGEGEQAFYEVLNNLVQGIKPGPFYLDKNPLDLNQVPNPYLEGILQPEPGDILHLETMRGCPFRCSYCYYPKSVQQIRQFPLAPVADFFKKARELKASEVYLMDPSFNSSPDFLHKLHVLAKSNSSSLPLHTELRLELLDKNQVSLLKEAGLASVEAGLQTTNPKALKKVCRQFHPEKFLHGATLLKEIGIELRIGLILGLPEDRIEDFSNTLDFIIENGLEEGLEIYPLSLLPGSRLASQAKSMDLEWMKLPPYQIISTPTMGKEDFQTAIEMIRDKLGRELFTPVIPHFTREKGGFISFLDLRGGQECNQMLEETWKLSNNLTLLLDRKRLDDGSFLMKAASSLKAFNPFTLLQFIIESDEPIPDEQATWLSNLFYNQDHYFERNHYLNRDNQGRFSTRVFQLTGNRKTMETLKDRNAFCDPLFRYCPGSLNQVRDFLSLELPLIFVPSGLNSIETGKLREIYEGFHELMIHDHLQKAKFA